jgi:hypothetical protein
MSRIRWHALMLGLAGAGCLGIGGCSGPDRDAVDWAALHGWPEWPVAGMAGLVTPMVSRRIAAWLGAVVTGAVALLENGSPVT